MRSLMLIIAVAGCTTQSNRTELLDQAHQASEQIDHDATKTFSSAIMDLIVRADQIRVEHNDESQTTTEFLGQGYDWSVKIDMGDKVNIDDMVYELLDTATELAK